MVDFYLVNPKFVDIPKNDKHVVYRWNKDDCNIYFSAAQQGKAISCHFSSDRPGLRKIKVAIDEWCKFVKQEFLWCRIILAKVIIESVKRMVKKCGFTKIASLLNNDGKTIDVYARALI